MNFHYLSVHLFPFVLFSHIDDLQYSKIGKVMRHIHLQPPDLVPRDEEFQFRSRAKALVDKWHVILSAYKEAGPGSNGTSTAPSSAAPSKIDKAEEDLPSGAAAVPAVETHPAVATIALVDDPEASRIKEWRHKLQKIFLNGTSPKPDVRLYPPYVFLHNSWGHRICLHAMGCSPSSRITTR